MNRKVLITLMGLSVVACLQTPQSEPTSAGAQANQAQSAVEVKNAVSTLKLTPLSASATGKSSVTALNATPMANAPNAMAEAPNALVAKAYAAKQSHVWVTGQGMVVKLLPDDNQGARHQRFLVRINPQQTLLFAHNIDLAPRIDRLQVGDEISFKGEYIYNPKGGILHWTHHDPQGHTDGYVRHAGQTYQ